MAIIYYIWAVLPGVFFCVYLKAIFSKVLKLRDPGKRLEDLLHAGIYCTTAYIATVGLDKIFVYDLLVKVTKEYGGFPEIFRWLQYPIVLYLFSIAENQLPSAKRRKLEQEKARSNFLVR